MRSLPSGAHGAAAVTDRLRALLDRAPADRRRTAASSGRSSTDTAATVADRHVPESPVPPAADLRSLPRQPDGAEPVPAVGAGFRSMIGRLDPGMPGARALAVVGLLSALATGGYLWLSRPVPQPASEPPAVSLATSPSSSSDRSPATMVVIHVYGKVRRPGVIRLPSGSRVNDAIRAAGGMRSGADTGALNLARRVVDGEQIGVGVPAPAAAPESAPVPGSPDASDTPLLDLNAATLEQFQRLPGVGPVLAQRIVDYRTRNGGFRSVEQLREVSGIGARRFADLSRLVRV